MFDFDLRCIFCCTNGCKTASPRMPCGCNRKKIDWDWEVDEAKEWEWIALVSLSDWVKRHTYGLSDQPLVVPVPHGSSSLSFCPGVIPALGHSVQQAGLPGSPGLPDQRRGQPAADGPGCTHALPSGGRRNVRSRWSSGFSLFLWDVAVFFYLLLYFVLVHVECCNWSFSIKKSGTLIHYYYSIIIIEQWLYIFRLFRTFRT